MGIHLPTVLANAKQLYRYSCVAATTDDELDVPKGHFAVYVGTTSVKRRFVVPISYLKHPWFQEFLHRAEEEFGFDHPITGGLTIPCEEDVFVHVTSRLKI